MILVSKARIRPVFRFENGKWNRYDQRVETDGHTIHLNGHDYDEKQLKDLTAELGVVSYGLNDHNIPTVFDFSSMHLCPCQLNKVRSLL